MGVSKSDVSRITGCEVQPKNFSSGKACMLPQRLCAIVQGNDDVVYSLEKYEVVSASEAAEVFGYGSIAHLIALQLFPSSGVQAAFPVHFLPVKLEGGKASKGYIYVSGSEAKKKGRVDLFVGGQSVRLDVEKGESAEDVMKRIVDEVNGDCCRCVTACFVEGVENNPSQIELVCRWSGEISNRISLSVSGDIEGLTFALTAFSGGSGVPDIAGALEKIGQVWETFILDPFDYKDEAGSASPLLDKEQAFGEKRWSALEKMPVLVAHGCVDDYKSRTAVSDGRKDDYVNFFVTSVGSPELPFVVCAKGLFEILSVANDNPAMGYAGKLKGLVRGDDFLQENYIVRNNSVKKGASTNIVNGSVAELNDVVTFYHPENEGNFPMRRHVVDAVKLMNIVYNLRLLTEGDDVKGAPLVPDNQVTTNPAALQPKTFKTWFSNLASSLGKNAIISDVDFTQKNIKVAIDSENSKRVNYVFPCLVSGNVEIVSGDVYFGQYTGE